MKTSSNLSVINQTVRVKSKLHIVKVQLQTDFKNSGHNSVQLKCVLDMGSQGVGACHCVQKASAQRPVLAACPKGQCWLLASVVVMHHDSLRTLLQLGYMILLISFKTRETRNQKR